MQGVRPPFHSQREAKNCHEIRLLGLHALRCHHPTRRVGGDKDADASRYSLEIYSDLLRFHIEKPIVRRDTARAYSETHLSLCRRYGRLHSQASPKLLRWAFMGTTMREQDGPDFL
jgi:hypothetical protein